MGFTAKLVKVIIVGPVLVSVVNASAVSPVWTVPKFNDDGEILSVDPGLFTTIVNAFVTEPWLFVAVTLMG